MDPHFEGLQCFDLFWLFDPESEDTLFLHNAVQVSPNVTASQPTLVQTSFLARQGVVLRS